MKTTNDAREQAAAKLASIRKLLSALDCDYDRLNELRCERDTFDWDEDANEAPGGPGYASTAEAWAAEHPAEADELAHLEDQANGCEDQEQAENAIMASALSVEVRTGWYAPGDGPAAIEDPAEYCITLTTGGPAVRIVGELECFWPFSARLEYQDWFTPWTPYTEDGDEILRKYATQFFFGQ